MCPVYCIVSYCIVVDNVIFGVFYTIFSVCCISHSAHVSSSEYGKISRMKIEIEVSVGMNQRADYMIGLLCLFISNIWNKVIERITTVLNFILIRHCYFVVKYFSGHNCRFCFGFSTFFFFIIFSSIRFRLWVHFHSNHFINNF